MQIWSAKSFISFVAPPRGERGLKLMQILYDLHHFPVAPPRGERGLKSAW